VPLLCVRAREMFASGPGVPFQANKKGPLGSTLSLSLFLSLSLCVCVCGPLSLSVCVCVGSVSLCHLLTRTNLGSLSSFFFVLLVVCYLVSEYMCSVAP
jgi:hypothetical protein